MFENIRVLIYLFFLQFQVFLKTNRFKAEPIFNLLTFDDEVFVAHDIMLLDFFPLQVFYKVILCDIDVFLKFSRL